jgi:putative endonuclease
MKRFTSETQKTGRKGEEICTKFLLQSGYEILERNYTVPQGEIDIIAEKSSMTHFIEVKSVSCENTEKLDTVYNPAENLTHSKLVKLQKAMNSWVKDNIVSHETQIDLYMVYIDKRNINHKIERIENIF